MKIVKQNQIKIFIFGAVKDRYMLHGRVFVMTTFSNVSLVHNSGRRIWVMMFCHLVIHLQVT